MPGNTGNIGRTCLGFNASLHLVEPAFEPTLERATRAGLDYWADVDLHVHRCADAFVRDTLPGLGRASWFTKHGEVPLHRAALVGGGDGGGGGCCLVLGSESDGFGSLLPRHGAAMRHTVSVPMDGGAIRCFNLASTAAMVAWEATRQRYALGAGAEDADALGLRNADAAGSSPPPASASALAAAAAGSPDAFHVR